MSMRREDIAERRGSAVVKECGTLADPKKRGRIELPVAQFVAQADVVEAGRRESRGHVATIALLTREYGTATLNRELLACVEGKVRRRRGFERSQVCGQVVDL